MGSQGIKDRVAIVGMGCTPFGEHWSKGADDLMVEAANEAFASAGVDKNTIDAYWLGTAMSGMSGITLARPLQVEGKPVTHVENHYNGARNSRAQFRREVSAETICGAPRLAGSLGVFDCAGVADGAAAAVVARAEDASRFTDKPIYVKALSLVAGTGSGLSDPDYDYTTFPEVAATAEDAYRQASVTDPRHELAMAEVHDCFTPTEMVLMEDLGFAARGPAWKEILAGTFDLDGALPVNPDGGLKSFGHPIGASGLRMLFEAWLQLRGESPEERRIPDGPPLALTHNLGGYPGEMVSFVSIVGSELE